MILVDIEQQPMALIDIEQPMTLIDIQQPMMVDIGTTYGTDRY